MTIWFDDPRSFALLTDLYELTMAYGYWRLGLQDTQVCFHLFFRRAPFGGSFAVAAGLESVLRYLENLKFQGSDLEYLASVPDGLGGRLFPEDFLAYLEGLDVELDLDAVPEGRVVFPGEPLVRVVGPLLQSQVVETALLNLVNFQTLVATKAARLRLAAGDGALADFGLRRAHGPDGALTASRSAYLGGVDATSNVLAGKLFGIPVTGTQAHSWVMLFDGEEEAFRRYLEVLPSPGILLVDTYDAELGTRRAVEAFRAARLSGQSVGVRVDSGDLAHLSRRIRAILDGAGLEQARIVASGDLDEYRIAELRSQGAPIDAWGVGTRLVTAYDEPALGGVYKLAAVRRPDGSWREVFKRSQDGTKRNLPGLLGVRRVRRAGVPVADVLYDIRHGFDERIAWDPVAGSEFELAKGDELEELLVPAMRRGRRVGEVVALKESRQRALEELGALPAEVAALHAHRAYPVLVCPTVFELEKRLWRDTSGR